VSYQIQFVFITDCNKAVAFQTNRENGIMHDYYARLTDRGMKRIKALLAVSRKLLGIIYAIALQRYINSFLQFGKFLFSLRYISPVILHLYP